MKIRDQVLEFHEKFDVPVRAWPGLPDPDEIRLRWALIFEEVKETGEALGFKSSIMEEIMAEIWAWNPDPNKVDLVELTDGLGDVDYVVEGCRQVFGVNGESIANEIHKTNMAKTGGRKDSTGKIRKPPGWKAPEIRRLLIEQGCDFSWENGKEENNVA